MAFLLIILFLLDGERAVLEQKVFPSMEACQSAGAKKVNDIELDEHKALIVAGCAQIDAQEVKK